MTSSCSSEPNGVDKWMRILTGSVAALSMFGCTVIIISYALWPRLRSKSRSLLVCLSVGDYMNALGVFVSSVWPPEGNDVGCKVQAVMTTCGSLLSFFWTSCLAIYIFIVIVLNNRELAKRLLVVFHVVSWGLPAVVTCVALVKGKLGYTESSDTVGWCWIEAREVADSEAVVWMVVTGKGWEIISYVVVVVLYIATKLYICQEKKAPKVFITKSTFETAQTINRKLTFKHCLAKSPIFLALHGIGDSAQGFANFIIFCVFTPKVHNHWINTICITFCCKWKEPRDPSEHDHLLPVKSNILAFFSGFRSRPPQQQNNRKIMSSSSC
ncbi:G-protein coupled receptor 157-like isoform X2 [Corticium candelabrum]|uniref:G-protein coupled receptor 157-like isoform X2 n=1 Tax=Corticium candelabrum TaxID=121492 RepID=UPI002E2642E3|nr:G-protein coupled receptor 157-like isoform X2 [Corticium candelabrum]